MVMGDITRIDTVQQYCDLFEVEALHQKKDVAGLTGIVQLCFVWQTCTWGMLKR